PEHRRHTADVHRARADLLADASKAGPAAVAPEVPRHAASPPGPGALGDGLLPAHPPRLPGTARRLRRGFLPLLRGRGPLSPGPRGRLVGLVRAVAARDPPPPPASPPGVGPPPRIDPARPAHICGQALAGLAGPAPVRPRLAGGQVPNRARDLA